MSDPVLQQHRLHRLSRTERAELELDEGPAVRGGALGKDEKWQASPRGLGAVGNCILARLPTVWILAVHEYALAGHACVAEQGYVQQIRLADTRNPWRKHSGHDKWVHQIPVRGRNNDIRQRLLVPASIVYVDAPEAEAPEEHRVRDPQRRSDQTARQAERLLVAKAAPVVLQGHARAGKLCHARLGTVRRQAHGDAHGEQGDAHQHCLGALVRCPRGLILERVGDLPEHALAPAEARDSLLGSSGCGGRRR
mmetsp:Transcript_77884/g.220812  ORF Transcript_77884/g.220812 Transcript_77884/m.220812 type:complete len:252 (-) Transcript_77884:77-832(-)